LYQQLLKIALLSAVSNMTGKPIVSENDVKFAYDMVIYYFHSIQEMAENNIFRNKTEEDTAKVLRIIKSSGEKGLSTRDLSRKARWLKKRERDEILKDLLENNFITLSIVKTAKRNKQVYRSTEC
jgi:DNA replicative helicase MCM subunit Mcm2 (Cdc46/Mcm family)